MPAQNSAGNPLSADSLSGFMALSLPKSATPQLKNAYDAIALAVHAGMIAIGFRLIGLGEDDRIEAQADAQNPQPLPNEWNATSSYAFRYAHSQSSMEFLVKVNRLGSKAVVMGLALGDDKTTTFDITVKDYISDSNLPSTPLSEGTGQASASQTLQNIFISAGRLSDFGSLLKLSIIQKLAPSLQKEGYEEEQTEQRGQSGYPNRPNEDPARREPPAPHEPLRDPEPARPHPFNDPLAVPRNPNRPLPEPIPGFEDEHEILRGPRNPLRDDRSPLNIGRDDLYPPGLGPGDPIRPHFGGGLPGPGGMGGGMHPTFDDPLFAGSRGGGGGYDPMAPPGARYDPVGPGGAPRDNRSGRGGFPGGGGGMGGRPPNPFSGFGSGDFI